MIHRFKTLFLLLFVFFCTTQVVRAQVYFEFLLRVPVVDTFGVDDGAVGQQFWMEADPSYTGLLLNCCPGLVDANGYVEDSIFVLGPGAGALLMHTLDCRGDTITTSVAFDSTFLNHVADTIFLCASNNLVCSITDIYAAQWGNATHYGFNYTASGTPVSSEWDFGDGTTLSAGPNGPGPNGIFHAYAVNGTYNVCVVTTFSDGCVASYCQPWNIVIGGQGSSATWFSYGVNGQTVNFQDSTTGTAPVQSWWWNFGDGSFDITTGPNVSHNYATQGPYDVTLETFTTDTFYDVATRTISLVPPLTCHAGFTHAPDTSGQYTILGYLASTGTNLSYHWNFGDNTTTIQPYPVHQYPGAGTYYICLTVAQPNPVCIDTYCDSVTVSQKMASAFTFAVWNPATVGVPTPRSSDGLHIAPHPVRERLHMTLPAHATGIVPVRIYNALGQLMTDSEVDFHNGQAEWDAAALPDGMYVVRIGTASARFWVLR